MSRGTFGAAIAFELSQCLGINDELNFLYAKGSRAPFTTTVNWAVSNAMEANALLTKGQRSFRDLTCRYYEQNYTTLYNYLESMRSMCDTYEYDVVVLAAAVSDFVVANYVDGKIRSKDALNIKLKPAPKIISEIQTRQPNAHLVGFKLLVNSDPKDLIQAAQQSIETNKCSLVIANDLSDIWLGQGHQRLYLVGGPEYVAAGGTALSILEKVEDDPGYLVRQAAQAIMRLGAHPKKAK